MFRPWSLGSWERQGGVLVRWSGHSCPPSLILCLLHGVPDLDSGFRHLLQKQIGRKVPLLEDAAALRDRSRSPHWYDDRCRKCGGAYPRAHLGFGIAVVDQSESGHAALEASAQRPAHAGRRHRCVHLQPPDADLPAKVSSNVDRPVRSTPAAGAAPDQTPAPIPSCPNQLPQVSRVYLAQVFETPALLPGNSADSRPCLSTAWRDRAGISIVVAKAPTIPVRPGRRAGTFALL